MKSDHRVYNVIFPIWLLWFFPPVFFIVAAGNFVVDSLVLFLAYRLIIAKVDRSGFGKLYRKCILKVWLFGFLADIIGTVPLIGLVVTGFNPFSYEVESAIMWNPWTNGIAFLFVLGCVVLAGALVFVFNHWFALKEAIPNQRMRLRTAILLAVLTAPYTLLLPTQWFYYN